MKGRGRAKSLAVTKCGLVMHVNKEKHQMRFLNSEEPVNSLNDLVY